MKQQKITLNDNIYIIEGFNRHCIYDLNTKQLYSLDDNILNSIKKILGNTNIKSHIEDQELFKLEQTLLENKILVENKFKLNNEMTVPVPKVDFAWIEVTKKCNLKCLHCYNEEHDLQITNYDMSLSDFCKVIDELEQNGIKNIQIIGGEPLMLGNKLFPMLDYIKNKFDLIQIFTNNTLMTEELADRLKKAGVDHVRTSIYSYLPNEHDKVTGVSGSFEKNKETLEILKEKNIQYSVATVSMKGITIGNSNTDLFKIKRTDCVRLSGKGNLSLYSKDLLKTKLITEHRFKHKLDASRVMHSMKFHNCFGSKIYIDTDLDIYPCAMERRFTLGNLNKKSLNEIIKPNEVSRLNKDKVDGCKVCEYRYACHDCRPDSLSDNIYAKPWNCTYDPYKGVWEDPEKFIENLLNM